MVILPCEYLFWSSVGSKRDNHLVLPQTSPTCLEQNLNMQSMKLSKKWLKSSSVLATNIKCHVIIYSMSEMRYIQLDGYYLPV